MTVTKLEIICRYSDIEGDDEDDSVESLIGVVGPQGTRGARKEKMSPILFQSW